MSDSLDPAKDNKRIRRAILGGVGLAAAAGGASWAFIRQGARQDSAAAGHPKGDAQGDPLPADFWPQRFDAPAGPALVLSSLQGRPLLINFWATWCPPCVKEMPELDRFHREFSGKGWAVLGLAVDGPTPVKQFLSKKPVGFQIGLAGMGGTELSQKLGNDAGGLPFSVMIDAGGRVRQRKMGATHFEELASWAKALTT